MDIPPVAAAVPRGTSANVVTSGETSDDDEDHYYENADATAVHHETTTASSSAQQAHFQNNTDVDEDGDKLKFTHPDDLYDANADDEDAAYVYKHLRFGLPEKIPVQTKVTTSASTAANTADSNKSAALTTTAQRQQLSVYKARNSDAVLACPACFNIVCMDCQQHAVYKDQYRAMFVLGIVVKWNEKLVYDAINQELVPLVVSSASQQQQQQHAIPQDASSNGGCDPPDVYYTVCCANCDTFVAALDMTDEVYHFQGCLASS